MSFIFGVKFAELHKRLLKSRQVETVAQIFASVAIASTSHVARRKPCGPTVTPISAVRRMSVCPSVRDRVRRVCSQRQRRARKWSSAFLAAAAALPTKFLSALTRNRGCPRSVGRTNGLTDGQMDGWMDGRTSERQSHCAHSRRRFAIRLPLF